MSLTNKPARVAIVGAGIVSPLGFGLAETLRSLKEGRDCVSEVELFDVRSCRCKTAGQVPDKRLETGPGAALPRPGRVHRATRMLLWAASEALSQAAAFSPDLAVVGTTSGGMTFGEQYFRGLLRHQLPSHTATLVANYPPQKPVTDTLSALQLDVPCQVIANACASGTNALGHAFECIRSGRYERVLAGGYDALSELVFVGFDSLQASTTDKCRPFDENRSGLVLGEGAAIFALENLERAKARGAAILAEFSGYGLSTDNHHLTQPDPSGIGPLSAMRLAITRAGLTPGDIDYVNAHGTATPFNDAAEGKAIVELFASVPVSSSKSMMGHALGAAGAIEAVVSLLSLREQFLPPNINHRRTDPVLAVNVVANEQKAAVVRRVLSNSFGFGGTNASLVLERLAA